MLIQSQQKQLYEADYDLWVVETVIFDILEKGLSDVSVN